MLSFSKTGSEDYLPIIAHNETVGSTLFLKYHKALTVARALQGFIQDGGFRPIPGPLVCLADLCILAHAEGEDAVVEPACYRAARPVASLRPSESPAAVAVVSSPRSLPSSFWISAPYR